MVGDRLLNLLLLVSLFHVGPAYLYPNPEYTPGVTNPKITQSNIDKTICNKHWSTKSIRPSETMMKQLKLHQLKVLNFKDQNPSHYEEDHFISLELGGHPTDPRNLWPEMWGDPDHPLTSKGPFPKNVYGAKAKDLVENALHKAVCNNKLKLEEAQTIIKTDWYYYYMKHIINDERRATS